MNVDLSPSSSEDEEIWWSKPKADMMDGVTASTVPWSPSPTSPVLQKPGFSWARGELIGQGNFGQVYTAMKTDSGELIAVKQVYIPRAARHRDNSRQMAVMEALRLENEVLKNLDHSNIVQYLGFEETPTCLSIFLEYVQGGSLGNCLRKYGRFEDTVTKSFTAQIIDGLEYLHSKGILHRDLKADNVLVEYGGVCKIADFGIAKRMDNIDLQNALTAMQGSILWMAPEVISTGKSGYNAKVDIWSVGCVAFEMWTGECPWRTEEAVAVIFKLYCLKQAPPLPQDVTLSPLAEDFRKRCFARDPDERPSAYTLRQHAYLVLPVGWTFAGFASCAPLNLQGSDNNLRPHK